MIRDFHNPYEKKIASNWKYTEDKFEKKLENRIESNQRLTVHPGGNWKNIYWIIFLLNLAPVSDFISRNKISYLLRPIKIHFSILRIKTTKKKKRKNERLNKVNKVLFFEFLTSLKYLIENYLPRVLISGEGERGERNPIQTHSFNRVKTRKRAATYSVIVKNRLQ